FRQDDFHFRHRDHWQKANEQEEQRGENPERADKGPDVHPGWNEQSPRRWKEITMQPADDDDESFEPHAGVHAHTYEIDDENVAATPAEPEELWRKHIAEQHAGPPIPPIRSEHAVPKRKPLPGIAAVPGNEKFHRVGVGHE